MEQLNNKLKPDLAECLMATIAKLQDSRARQTHNVNASMTKLDVVYCSALSATRFDCSDSQHDVCVCVCDCVCVYVGGRR